MSKSTDPEELPRVEITIPTRTFVRIAILTVATLVLIYSANKASHALVLIFIAFFLALALNAPVYWISKRLPGKRKNSRASATTLSFLIVILLLAGVLAIIIPPLVRQTDVLIKQAPHLIKEFRNQNSPIGKFIRQHHLQSQVSSFSAQLSERLSHISSTAVTSIGHVGSSIFSMLTIVVLTFMMLVEGPTWISFFKKIVPRQHHVMADEVSREMYKVIRGYVNGQVFLAALASAVITPAIVLLHISFPAALVLVIFICGLIPMIGHAIGAVIITTVALFHSTSAAIIIFSYYLAYMALENYIIQPKVQANSTNMSPLLVFSSVVVGVSFGGILGGLLAIPLAGCIRIAVLEYLFHTNRISANTLEATAEVPKADTTR